MTNQELLKQAVLMGEQFYSETAQVLSVDDTKRTCTVKILKTDCKIEGVHLQSLESEDKGLYLKPIVNSHVVIGFTSKNHAVVLVYGEIETVKIDSLLFQFNDGLFGGMIKIDAIVTWMIQVGTAINTLTGTTAFNVIPATIKQSLENPKVKHG